MSISDMSRRNFRLLIIFQWLLIIGMIVVSFATEGLLPPELKGYLDAQVNAPFTTADTIILIVAGVYTIFAFVVSVGLFLFKRWAKVLLLLSIVIGSLLTIVFGPYVETGWQSFLSELGSLTDGIILALVYFSPISRMFEIDSL